MITVYDSNGMEDDFGFGDSLPLAAPRLGANVTSATTLTDLVDEIDATLLNDSLNLTLTADVPNPNMVPTGPDGQPINIITTGALVTDGGAPWFVQGRLSKQASNMSLTASPAATRSGGAVTLRGEFYAADAYGKPVTIYRGTSTTPYATVPVYVTPDGVAFFSLRAKVLSKNTKFRAVWNGSDQFLATSATRTVRVHK